MSGELGGLAQFIVDTQEKLAEQGARIADLAHGLADVRKGSIPPDPVVNLSEGQAAYVKTAGDVRAKAEHDGWLRGYDEGGVLPPESLIYNGEPIPVLTESQWQAARQFGGSGLLKKLVERRDEAIKERDEAITAKVTVERVRAVLGSSGADERTEVSLLVQRRIAGLNKQLDEIRSVTKTLGAPDEWPTVAHVEWLREEMRLAIEERDAARKDREFAAQLMTARIPRIDELPNYMLASANLRTILERLIGGWAKDSAIGTALADIEAAEAKVARIEAFRALVIGDVERDEKTGSHHSWSSERLSVELKEALDGEQ